MKIALSRQTLYMLIMALILLIVVLAFAFLLLIPKGKTYRLERLAMKKELAIEREYQQWHDDTFAILQQMRSKNRHIIAAFDNPFNAQQFINRHRNHFESLELSRLSEADRNGSEYAVYEVNATSKIDSPQLFYDFLDQVNKSEWIIGVQFPIRFEREGNLIRSSFCMQVYSVDRSERNASNTSGSS